MLDKGMLKDDIKGALDDTLPPAIEECINNIAVVKDLKPKKYEVVFFRQKGCRENKISLPQLTLLAIA